MFRRRSLRGRTALAALVAVGVTGAVAACSSSGGGGSAAPSGSATAATACPTSSTPVTLDYWSWGAGYPDAAKLWNSTHPNIQVKYSDIPVGNAGGYQKMFNALKAGTAPDVGFLEFDTIPAFASQGGLLNVAQYATAAQKADFLKPFLNQASVGQPGAIYNVPLGGGPMALIYRKDLFDKNGIKVPATWDEFATTAAQVHKIDPKATLANFDGYGNANWLAGLASQAGAQWFTPSGDGWKVTVDDSATQKTVALWQSMLQAHTASDLATFSPEWSAALADGDIWSWPTAVWGAGVIKGSAPKTSGDWAVAPLPAWTAGQQVSGSWGGGGLSVFKTSKHPCEAAQFALWMGTNSEAMKILNKAIGIYPTTNTLLADPLFTQPDAFFGGQKIFDVFRASSSNLPNFTWGPAMTDTYKSLTDALSSAKSSGASMTQALTTAQSSVVSSMQKDGFTVSQ